MAVISGISSTEPYPVTPATTETAAAYSGSGMLALGNSLHGTYTRYKSDRRWKEQVWLKALRQFRGIYDSDVIIGKNRSRAYPRLTRAKVVTAVSKLMEMLFPTGDKNWALKVSENPQISQDVLNDALATLQTQLNASDIDEQLTQAIYQVLNKRTANMTGVIESQLREHYVDMIRSVIKSAVMYGTGVLHGPFVNQNTMTRPQRDPQTGQYSLATIQQYEPTFQFISVWDFYPDLAAFSWEQCDGFFFRRIMNRAGLRSLADRPDFLNEPIMRYLRDHTTGNYEPTYFENEIKAMGSQKMPSGSTDKFEIMSYWGTVSGHTLIATGMPQFQGMEAESVECNLWLIDNTVIKATLNPYSEKFRPVHIFTYEEDDSSLLGDGVPMIMEDSQRAICAGTRMMLDNASATAGPMVEVNIDLMADPTGDSADDSLHPFKVFAREGTGAAASVPAVRDITVNNHVPELLNIIKQMREFADEETSVQLTNINADSINSEAMRTTVGMSMLFGNSNTNLRNVVRNFDQFTSSVIRSMVHWNAQFNSSPDIQGDHDVTARGSSALVARELQSQALDSLATGLSDDEKIFLNAKKILIHRLKMHNLPVEELLNSEEDIANAQQQQAQQAQETIELGKNKTNAEIKQLLATAYMNLAKGDAEQVNAVNDVFAQLYQQLGELNATDSEGAAAGSPSPTPNQPGQPSLSGLPNSAGLPVANGGGGNGSSAGLPGIASISPPVPSTTSSIGSYRAAPAAA